MEPPAAVAPPATPPRCPLSRWHSASSRMRSAFALAASARTLASCPSLTAA